MERQYAVMKPFDITLETPSGHLITSYSRYLVFTVERTRIAAVSIYPLAEASDFGRAVSRAREIVESSGLSGTRLLSQISAWQLRDATVNGLGADPGFHESCR
jgi:hypothetical protein